MPMPDQQYQKINAAYALSQTKVINPNGVYSQVRDVIVLVQNGTAGIAHVTNGTISYWQPAYVGYGYPKASEVVDPHTKLPNPFRDGINTIFPDYDIGDGRCWVTNGNQILSYHFTKQEQYGNPTHIKTLFSQIPQQFQDGWGAALTCHKNKVWLFKGNQFTALEQDGTSITFSDPQSIGERWKHNGKEVPLIRDGIDAALRLPGSNTGYLFRGDKYVQVNTETGEVTSEAQLIRTYWHGVPYLYPVPDAILRDPHLAAFTLQRFLFLWNQYCIEGVGADTMASVRQKSSTPAKPINDFFPGLDPNYANGVQRGFAPLNSPDGYSYLMKDTKLVKVKEKENVQSTSSTIGYSGGQPLQANDFVPWAGVHDWYLWDGQRMSVIMTYRKQDKQFGAWWPGREAQYDCPWYRNARNTLADKNGPFLDHLQAACMSIAGPLLLSTEPRVSLIQSTFIPAPQPKNNSIERSKLIGPNVFNYELPWPS